MTIPSDRLKRSILLGVFLLLSGVPGTTSYTNSIVTAYGETAPAGKADAHLQRRLPAIAPAEWELMEPVKSFSPNNLWQQINGRAEFFLSYGMVRMIFAVYTRPPDSEVFIDVAVYNLGEPTHAFGAFSAERQKEQESVNLGRRGYRSGASLFFWKGPYYVRIIASEEDAATKNASFELAERVAGLLEDTGKSVWGLEILPRADRIPGTEQYFRKDAMGLDFMQNTYTARYRIKGVEIDMFILKETNQSAATAVFDKYTAYAKQFGEGFRQISQGGKTILLFDMDGSYDALFQKDSVVAGITAVEDSNLAVEAAFEFQRQLDGK